MDVVKTVASATIEKRKEPCLTKSKEGKPCILLSPHIENKHEYTVYNAITTKSF